MVKVVAILRRKAGITKEEFQLYYENTHSNLVLYHLRALLVDYRRTYPVKESLHSKITGGDTAIVDDTRGFNFDAPSYEPSFEYDVITELWFQDQSKFNKAFAVLSRPDVRAVIEADEEKFVDRSSIRVFLCDEFMSSL